MERVGWLSERGMSLEPQATDDRDVSGQPRKNVKYIDIKPTDA